MPAESSPEQILEHLTSHIPELKQELQWAELAEELFLFAHEGMEAPRLHVVAPNKRVIFKDVPQNPLVYIGSMRKRGQLPTKWSARSRDTPKEICDKILKNADHLSELAGKTLVCNCGNEETCHGRLIIGAFNSAFSDI